LNSKQILAAASVVVLVVVLVYPTLSMGTVSVGVRSMQIPMADHLYITVDSVWVHQRGQASSNGWTVVVNKSQTVDLISAINSTKPLGSGQLSAATYDAVRVDVSNVTWVFNKTTTALSIPTPNLDSTLNFTLGSGQNLSITLVVGGRQETTGTSKFFVANLNATLT
jgi:hypothetical protein